MAMRTSVGFTVDTMLAIAQSTANAALHMWLAHSLLLIANAAGLSYVPYVQAGNCASERHISSSNSKYAVAFGHYPQVGKCK